MINFNELDVIHKFHDDQSIPVGRYLYLTRGLPGCSKSTWSSSWEHYLTYKGLGPVTLLTKDDIRNKFADYTEKDVIKYRNQATRNTLATQPVLWSDTNLNPVHINSAIGFAQEFGTQVVVVDFTNISVEECIKRDLTRLKSVGQDVIYKFHFKYLHQKPQLVQDKSLSKAIIADIDGTVAWMNGRSPYHFDKVGTDLPNEGLLDILDILNQSGIKILFTSGRPDSCYVETLTWLERYIDMDNCELLMRKSGDLRKDSVVKHEIYKSEIESKYNILAVYDDRPSVAEMWRSLGLNVCQLGDPNNKF